MYQLQNKKILNLKSIVDSTISTAAGLEKGSSYSVPYQALPYYQSSNVSFRYGDSEST